MVSVAHAIPSTIPWFVRSSFFEVFWLENKTAITIERTVNEVEPSDSYTFNVEVFEVLLWPMSEALKASSKARQVG